VRVQVVREELNILVNVGTFSSTQRKCTDKQNLLFSTLAPGTSFVLSTKMLYTWPHNRTMITAQLKWSVSVEKMMSKELKQSNNQRTSLIMGKNSLAGWKSTASFAWKKTKKYESMMRGKDTMIKILVSLIWLWKLFLTFLVLRLFVGPLMSIPWLPA